MKLMKLSYRTSNVISAAVGIVPGIAIGKYFVDLYKMKKFYASNDIEIARLQEIADSMPKTAEEYDVFIKNGDPNAIKCYQEVYTDLKESGVGDAFYQNHGFDNEREFWNQVDDYYQAGLEGDLGAQGNFNDLVNSYNNAIYEQASGQASQNFLDMSNFGNLPNVDMSMMDLAVGNTQKTLICVLFAGLIGVAAYDIYSRYRQKKLGDEGKYVEKKSMFNKVDLKDKLFTSTDFGKQRENEIIELRCKMEYEKSLQSGYDGNAVMIPDSFVEAQMRKKKRQDIKARFFEK